MKGFFLWFAVFAAVLSAPPLSAQLITKDISLRYRSDSSSQSVLLSNLLPDEVGNQSPFIGTAYWSDSSRLLECRSMLSFDLGMLNKLIKPGQVVRATLVLHPIKPVEGATKSESRDSRLIVRRVVDTWEDSATTWLNQPKYTADDQVIKKVPAEKMNETVKINVTEIVRNMLLFGNNGFLICFPERDKMPASASQWFASSRNEKKEIRPVLLLDFYVVRGSTPYFPTSPLIEVMNRTEYLKDDHPTKSGGNEKVSVTSESQKTIKNKD